MADWDKQQLAQAEVMPGQMLGIIRNPTITERLEEERKTLSDRIAILDEALSALRANPQLQALFDVLSKATHY